MKISILLLAILFSFSSSAQEIKLADTTIFFNNKPVAYYYKDLNKTISKNNIEVTNLVNDFFIKAEVIKFSAPVEELKTFYYYEITFPPVADTISVYVEEEDFSLVLARIIRDYQLIVNDQLNIAGIAKFKSTYPGAPALVARIESFTSFLNATRYFSEQVVRDRSKPVKLINDRVIMQDGIRIGTVAVVQNLQITNLTQQIQPLENLSDYNIRSANAAMIIFENGRQVDDKNEFTRYQKTLTKGEKGYTLYNISKDKKLSPGSYTDQLLKRICYLIEDYAL